MIREVEIYSREEEEINHRERRKGSAGMKVSLGDVPGCEPDSLFDEDGGNRSYPRGKTS